jgi:hypothetical protein
MLMELPAQIYAAERSVSNFLTGAQDPIGSSYSTGAS